MVESGVSEAWVLSQHHKEKEKKQNSDEVEKWDYSKLSKVVKG